MVAFNIDSNWLKVETFTEQNVCTIFHSDDDIDILIRDMLRGIGRIVSCEPKSNNEEVISIIYDMSKRYDRFQNRNMIMSYKIGELEYIQNVIYKNTAPVFRSGFKGSTSGKYSKIHEIRDQLDKIYELKTNIYPVITHYGHVSKEHFNRTFNFESRLSEITDRYFKTGIYATPLHNVSEKIYTRAINLSFDNNKYTGYNKIFNRDTLQFYRLLVERLDFVFKTTAPKFIKHNSKLAIDLATRIFINYSSSVIDFFSGHSSYINAHGIVYLSIKDSYDSFVSYGRKMVRDLNLFEKLKEQLQVLLPNIVFVCSIYDIKK